MRQTKRVWQKILLKYDNNSTEPKSKEEIEVQVYVIATIKPSESFTEWLLIKMNSAQVKFSYCTPYLECWTLDWCMCLCKLLQLSKNTYGAFRITMIVHPNEYDSSWEPLSKIKMAVFSLNKWIIRKQQFVVFINHLTPLLMKNGKKIPT